MSCPSGKRSDPSGCAERARARTQERGHPSGYQPEMSCSPATMHSSRTRCPAKALSAETDASPSDLSGIAVARPPTCPPNRPPRSFNRSSRRHLPVGAMAYQMLTGYQLFPSLAAAMFAATPSSAPTDQHAPAGCPRARRPDNAALEKRPSIDRSRRARCSPTWDGGGAEWRDGRDQRGSDLAQKLPPIVPAAPKASDRRGLYMAIVAPRSSSRSRRRTGTGTSTDRPVQPRPLRWRFSPSRTWGIHPTRTSSMAWRRKSRAGSDA